MLSSCISSRTKVMKSHQIRQHCSNIYSYTIVMISATQPQQEQYFKQKHEDLEKRTYRCTSASLSSQTAEKLFNSRTVCAMKVLTYQIQNAVRVSGKKSIGSRHHINDIATIDQGYLTHNQNFNVKIVGADVVSYHTLCSVTQPQSYHYRHTAITFSWVRCTILGTCKMHFNRKDWHSVSKI